MNSTRGMGDAAQHGTWEWDARSARLTASARCKEIAGEALGAGTDDWRRWIAAVHPEDSAAVQAAVEKCIGEKADWFHVAARVKGARGQWKCLLACGAVVERDDAGAARRLAGSLIEISPQDATQQLAESDARAQAIIGSAMDAIITVDEGQRIIQFNAAAEAIFGFPAGEIVGKPLDRLIPERFRAVHREHIARFGATGVTMRRMGGSSVLYGLRAGGGEFPIDASISQVDVGGRKLFTVILRDVTEREHAARELERSHRELRDLYSAMHEIRESERTRIARELHDELAQWLTALKMDVSWLKSKLAPEQAPLVARTEKMRELVDTMVTAVRRIAADLRPPILDELGLAAAVENLLHDFSGRSGIVVSLDLEPTGLSFEDPFATAVYRMIQEALTNVARHAEASEVDVSLRLADGALRVKVKDNGKGVDSAMGKEKSFGVAGIRERARTLGGYASIYSPSEGGTLVDIVIPVGPHHVGSMQR